MSIVDFWGLLRRQENFLGTDGFSGVLPLPSLTSPVAAIDMQLYATNAFQDSAKTTPATADGDVLGGVVQVTGFGATDAVQATTANKPLLKLGANGINGHAAASFDGTSDYLDWTGVTAASGAKTFYIVYKPTALGSTPQNLFGSTSFGVAHITNTLNQTGYFAGSWRSVATATTDIQLMAWALGSGTGTMYRNGASIGTAVYPDTAISGGASIGATNTGVQNFGGLIGAIYIYNALHTATELALMTAYLKQRWSIA